VFLNSTLRNRNPLHPSVLDALVIGALWGPTVLLEQSPSGAEPRTFRGLASPEKKKKENNVCLPRLLLTAMPPPPTGNLLNFPKHVFGMPFGSYGTDGNESLSLVLYGYRLKATDPNAR